MREKPSYPRPPPPVDPVGRWPFARRRYERRWGFLPFEGREDLPPTGRTTLFRVEWGRSGRDVCVMLARWEHHRGAWRRMDVVATAWVRGDDGPALGEARFDLGRLGERLEDEADDRRLAGRLPELLPVLAVEAADAEAPHVPKRAGVKPADLLPRVDASSGMGGDSPVLPVAVVLLATIGAFASGNLVVGIVLGGLVALNAIVFGRLWLGHRRADRSAPGGFMPFERRRRLPRSGRRTLYRVHVGRRGDARCVMVVVWRFRRRRWRRDGVVEHVWVRAAGEREALRRMEARARALERADRDDLAEPDRWPRRRDTAADAAIEAELSALQDDLDATDDLVEDLARDPR